jgi:hypothetical protein
MIPAIGRIRGAHGSATVNAAFHARPASPARRMPAGAASISSSVRVPAAGP